MLPSDLRVRRLSCKTHQFRQGDSCLLLGQALLRALWQCYSVTTVWPLFLSSPNCVCLGELWLQEMGSAFTLKACSVILELFLNKLAELGFDPKQFGLHSLRSGGATAAANSGVPDRLFKRHGRWRSESAKDGYVKDSYVCLSEFEIVTVHGFPFSVTLVSEIMTFLSGVHSSALSHVGQCLLLSVACQ